MSKNEELIKKIEELLFLSEADRQKKREEIDACIEELISLNWMNQKTVVDILFAVFSKHKTEADFLDAFIAVFIRNVVSVDSGSDFLESIFVNLMKNESTKSQAFQMINVVLAGKEAKVKQQAYLALSKLWDQGLEQDRIQIILTENYFEHRKLKWMSNEKLKNSYSLTLFCVMKSNNESQKALVLTSLQSYLLSTFDNEKLLVKSVLKRLMRDSAFPNESLRDLLVEFAERDQRTIISSFSEAFDPERHASMLVDMLLDKKQSKVGLACLSKLSRDNKMWLVAAVKHAYGQQEDANAALNFVSTFLSYCTLEEVVDWMEIKGLDTEAAGFSNKFSDLKEKDKLNIEKCCTNILLNKKAIGDRKLFLWSSSFKVENERTSLAKTLRTITHCIEAENKTKLGF